MAAGLSDVNTANQWLNVLRGGGVGVTFTAPGVQAVQLHTANPGAVGTTAVSVGSATRNAVTFGAAAAGSMSMSSTAPVWTNGGTSETLTHISVWSATSAGNFHYSGALTTSQAWASGNTFTLTTLSVSLTPIAS